MVALGYSDRDAAAMGHVPMSGAGGSLAVLAALPGKYAYLHVNNTNPVLRMDSDARAAVERVGVRLAEDGERWVI
jgi:pyrroloquinoline quinone biosynthesis protein B